MNLRQNTKLVCVVLVLGSVLLSGTATGQRGQVDPCDELRTRLAVSELERATLTHKVRDLESRLADSADSEGLRARAEAAEASASDSRKRADALQSRVTALEAERKRLSDELAQLRRAAKPPTTVAKSDTPASRTGWRHYEDTTVDGMLREIKRGTVFKTTSGTIYEVTDFIFDFGVHVNPTIVVLTDDMTYKLIVDGVAEAILCNKLSGSAAEGAGGEVIESRIADAFEGFELGKIFKLANGQIWEQSSATYRYRYKYGPKVIIWRAGRVWKMKVDGVDNVVSVTRLK